MQDSSMEDNSNSIGKTIYQFKITLRAIKPPIWRLIQVPSSFTFGQLHLAIQKSMGWGCHLHQFKIKGDVITTNLDTVEPSLAEDDIDERMVCIDDYFRTPKQKALYEYDFGDGWEHEVVLEKIFLAKEGEKYPKCLAGKRACPPDDCGGYSGYEELLEALNDSSHRKHKYITKWLKSLGKLPFDPEMFSPDHVFDDFQEFESIYLPYN